MTPSAKHNKKGIILCCGNGEWKDELEERLKTDENVTLTALGMVKLDILTYLNQRRDIEILKLETKYMKNWEKGMGLKVTVTKSHSLEKT